MVGKLANAFSLQNQIKVYVPSTVNVSEVIDNSRQVDEGLELLSKLFGGASANDVEGCWFSDVAGLVKEKVKVIYAFVEELDPTKIDKVVEFAEKLKVDMSQEAIALELNGRMYFI